MKRLRMLAFMLVCTLLLTAVIPVSAVGATSLLAIEETEIRTNGSAVGITLTTSETVFGGSFVIAYDSSLIAYSHATHGDFTCVINAMFAQNKMKVSFASSSAITDSQLLQIMFVATAAEACTTELRLEDVHLYDQNAYALHVETANAVCTVKPSTPLNNVSFAQSEWNLGVGESWLPTLRTDPIGGDVESTEWGVWDSSIASVSSDGRVTGLAVGETTVYCSVWDSVGNSFTATCRVQVYRKPTVSTDSVYLTKGNTVTVPVRLSTMENEFYSGSLNLSYDPSVLKLLSLEQGPMLQAGLVTLNPTYREDTARINFAGQLPITGSGVLCYATFETLQNGVSKVIPKDVLLFLEDGTSCAAMTGAGEITVDQGMLSLSDVNGLAHRGFTVTLAYQGALPVAGGSLCITYDPAKLKLGTVKALDGSFFFQINPTYQEHQIRISFAGTKDVTAAELLEISFVSLENEDIQSSVSLSSVQLYNCNGRAVTVDQTDATVLLQQNDITAEKGELSGDDVINTWDASLLARYLSGDTTVELLPEAADLNGDHWVNEEDMALLMKYLAEWDLEAFA
ncbi:MAG: Ig-like domain-containing protein [Clostridia bacterium]|nr:Ig-like domain-containing protein [Clostridia bacterium]